MGNLGSWNFSNAMSVALLFLALLFHNFSLADVKFDDSFKSVVRELTESKIPRPKIRRWEKSQELVESIHFRIYDITKTICSQENIQPNDCRWNSTVVRSPVFNAFIKGSGQIVISTGLVDKVTYEDELAFVVAHEVAHQVLDHIDKNKGIVVAGTILAGLLLDDFIGGVIFGSAVGQLSSRKDESSADALALRIISLAGYDPSKARYVLMRMAKMDVRLTSKFMQSHPSGVERIVMYDKILDRL